MFTHSKWKGRWYLWPYTTYLGQHEQRSRRLTHITTLENIHTGLNYKYQWKHIQRGYFPLELCKGSTRYIWDDMISVFLCYPWPQSGCSGWRCIMSSLYSTPHVAVSVNKYTNGSRHGLSVRNQCIVNPLFSILIGLGLLHLRVCHNIYDAFVWTMRVSAYILSVNQIVTLAIQCCLNIPSNLSRLQTSRIKRSVFTYRCQKTWKACI